MGRKQVTRLDRVPERDMVEELSIVESGAQGQAFLLTKGQRMHAREILKVVIETTAPREKDLAALIAKHGLTGIEADMVVGAARLLSGVQDLATDELLRGVAKIVGYDVPDEDEQVEQVEWDAVYINDLPDDAFLYVEDGGEKDDAGKTVPRSLRHFPVRNAAGNVDLPHLRNALSRIPQSSLPESVRDAAAARARALLAEATEETKGDGVATDERREEETEMQPNTDQATPALKADDTTRADVAALQKASAEKDAALAKQATEIEALRKSHGELLDSIRTEQFVQKAATEFAHLPGTAAEVGSLLKVLHDQLDADTVAKVERMLATANASLKTEKMFHQVSAPGRASAGSAWERINALAGELRKVDPKLTTQQAVSRVLELHPELRQIEKAERKAGLGR